MNTIHVGLATDKNHISHITNVINSVVYNKDASTDIIFHIITRDCHLPRINYKNIYQYKISHKFNSSLLPSAFPHYTASAMDRSFFPDLCKEIERIIYLDTDVIVLNDLTELYEHITGDCGIGARLNIDPTCTTIANNFTRLHIDYFISKKNINLLNTLQSMDINVFNSGVMIMDLNKMRKNNMTNIVIDINDKLGIDDQLSLSIYSNNRFATISNHWNRMIMKEGIDKDAKILHWAGIDKPWNVSNIYRHIWKEYL